jgi:hypothetical protein
MKLENTNYNLYKISLKITYNLYNFLPICNWNTGGQGYLSCKCKAGCKTSKCKCKKKYPVYFTLSWFYDMLKQVNLKTGSWLKELLPQLETEEDLEQILADAGEGDTADGAKVVAKLQNASAKKNILCISRCHGSMRCSNK